MLGYTVCYIFRFIILPDTGIYTRHNLFPIIENNVALFILFQTQDSDRDRFVFNIFICILVSNIARVTFPNDLSVLKLGRRITYISSLGYFTHESLDYK